MKKYTWLIPEYWALMRAHFINTFFPYNPTHWSEGDKGDVVIVQGFNDKASYLRKIGDSVNALGYRVHTLPELGRQHAPIKTQSEKLAKYLNSNNLKDYYILAHSKGSLVTKYTIDNITVPLPRKIFALAPPFDGSVFGHVPLLNLHEMKRGSEILRTLASRKENNHLFVTIYPTIDNMIINPNSSYLEGAENIKLPICGHTVIMESDEMIQIIVDRITNFA